jgi:hypothetical protein
LKIYARVGIYQVPCTFSQDCFEGMLLTFLTILTDSVSKTVHTNNPSLWLPHMHFSACLTRLGFDVPTRELVVNQGIASIHDLANLPFPEIDKMIQHLSRWKPKAVEDDDDYSVAGPTFPYLSVKKFKALRA